jgi:hypothetical protein
MQIQTNRALNGHRVDHRVLAIYGESDLTVFELPRNATMADLAESVARRAPARGQLPLLIEVNLAH